MSATEFWIRCRTCDGDGPHGWVCLPTASTRGRWAADHQAETGHHSWQVHDGPLGVLTARRGASLDVALDDHSDPTGGPVSERTLPTPPTRGQLRLRRIRRVARALADIPVHWWRVLTGKRRANARRWGARWRDRP